MDNENGNNSASQDLQVGSRNGLGASSWIALIVVFGIIGIIAIPAIRNAREAAQRTHSSNNLKQIALALHNYHDTRKRFPEGAMLGRNGQVLHGWETPILPYIEASPLYWMLELESPWDDPFNQHVYRLKYRPYQNERVSLVRTSDGHGLTHYSANQRIFHIGSRFGFSDFTYGSSNSWMISEIFDDFRPWGAPHNWHDLSFPPPIHANVSGWRLGGINIAMGDGSVSYLDRKTSTSSLDQIRNNIPQPENSKISKPPNRFEFLSDSNGWTKENYVVRRPEDGSMSGFFVGAEVWIDQQRQTSNAYVSSHRGKIYGKVAPDDLRSVVTKYPDLETLVAHNAVDENTIRDLQTCQNLKHLKMAKLDLNDENLGQLKELKSLEILSVAGDNTIRDKLIKILPKCEIRVRRIDEFGFDD